DLYAGVAGVSLFLACLYRVTSDQEHRRTAIGALRQALATAKEIPPRQALGFFGGCMGVAWAAHCIGTGLGDEKLVEQASDLSRACVAAALKDPSCSKEEPFDLMSGTAGSIVALAGMGIRSGVTCESSVESLANRLWEQRVDTDGVIS